jgi:hypothetical protein
VIGTADGWIEVADPLGESSVLDRAADRVLNSVVPMTDIGRAPKSTHRTGTPRAVVASKTRTAAIHSNRR